MITETLDLLVYKPTAETYRFLLKGTLLAAAWSVGPRDTEARFQEEDVDAVTDELERISQRTDPLFNLSKNINNIPGGLESIPVFKDSNLASAIIDHAYSACARMASDWFETPSLSIEKNRIVISAQRKLINPRKSGSQGRPRPRSRSSSAAIDTIWF